MVAHRAIAAVSKVASELKRVAQNATGHSGAGRKRGGTEEPPASSAARKQPPPEPIAAVTEQPRDAVPHAESPPASVDEPAEPASTSPKEKPPKKALPKQETPKAAKRTAAKESANSQVPIGQKTAKKAAAKKKSSQASKKAPKVNSGKKKNSVNETRSQHLLVAAQEEPWTKQELAAIQAEIEADIVQLGAELSFAEADLVDLMRDSGDGAGDDQADAGAKTYEREQEISVANNARDMLEQNKRALERLKRGTYGICEVCDNPIGKLRLQAAPRATLCLKCKSEEERR